MPGARCARGPVCNNSGRCTHEHAGHTGITRNSPRNGLRLMSCPPRRPGFLATVTPASTGAELRALVTDINLACVMSGVELAQYAKRKFPAINVVMVSGKGPPCIPQETHFLLKSYRPSELLEAFSIRHGTNGTPPRCLSTQSKNGG